MEHRDEIQKYNAGDKVVASSSERHGWRVRKVREEVKAEYGCCPVKVENVRRTVTGRCDCRVGNQVDKESHLDWCGLLDLHPQVLVIRLGGGMMPHSGALFDLFEDPASY
ncbi:MAG: hypothetical protein A3C80_01985 [Candidatus Ryanbacteria bacterium RIFCSPHIGHO2_02_FULL_45_43]|uniref:Uncharacterized protein n=1 Tax=Candidatus Ryanbacteria bacterium RIFCSPHIGHO2_01_45_13 TaxID=1802112 RepID=A0A1G2FZI7_9BACT|nr:MAG: hypothetical protein A2718_02815 [Candidatus Ryanbacteria bacterium RIFCSPHIGHO2_01_FULL_44_130]OGZ43010.1 MAG: hypothetical protein A2W41_02760 [Candidatus Ryanbacteria bacterium RIFCSPHIGHO2_01_45_13]OGZ48715.1 MAG: hypothetical protein A3C80_01985 [Candidatus Ryanbacteria bacterium RIFCSPHIGHO2_02_FULL_45_43]OGZ50655.1 MAG: hypothetical protein A3E55_03465 [Candidatus Ryanbacteria bacterium RIFCSPHIGHO2_12_FULL_44_20]OGZ51961.1 MAG: hypothetical protein A3A17_00840 [Candidatus Ryanba